MNINIQNSNSLGDKKKFWLITSSYLVIFLFLPLVPIIRDNFFNFLNLILDKVHIDIESIIIYFFVFFPILICIYYLFIKKLNLKFKKTLFTIFYIVLPYILIISFFFYVYMKVSQNFNPTI